MSNPTDLERPEDAYFPAIDYDGQPAGWFVVVQPIIPAERTSGGILLPDKAKDFEKALQTIAKVVAVGDLAYADPVKFPNGAWCKVGDYVRIPSYAGAKHPVIRSDHKGYIDLKIFNDDEILDTVKDFRRYIAN